MKKVTFGLTFNLKCTAPMNIAARWFPFLSLSLSLFDTFTNPRLLYRNSLAARQPGNEI